VENAIFQLLNKGDRKYMIGEIPINYAEMDEYESLLILNNNLIHKIITSKPQRNDICRC